MKLLIIALFFVSTHSHANIDFPKGFSPSQEENIQIKHSNILQNALLSLSTINSTNQNFRQKNIRSFAEYEDVGYLFMSRRFRIGSKNIKQTIAKNLPKNVTLVIYTGDPSPAEANLIRSEFKNFINLDRLKIIYLPDAEKGFWTRDALPYPVFNELQNGPLEFSLVDARYGHKFEPDEDIAGLFSVPLLKHDFYFEGGNLIVNTLGDCLTIDNSQSKDILNSLFKDFYGCERLVRLPHVRLNKEHLKGIGHADERVKFVDDQTVLTDEKSYVDPLIKAGFKVITLPIPTDNLDVEPGIGPQQSYETYVNSVIVNGTVFVPTFGEVQDSEAIKIYKKIGFQKVVPIPSAYLATHGQGILHCITMTYPNMEWAKLIDQI